MTAGLKCRCINFVDINTWFFSFEEELALCFSRCSGGKAGVQIRQNGEISLDGKLSVKSVKSVFE